MGVPADRLDALWLAALPYIERALSDDAGHFTAEDVRAAVEDRRMQLWLLFDGAAVGALVTEIAAWPRVKVCRLVLAAADDGHRDGWMACRGELEEWARRQGCGRMEAYGRPGWARVVRNARSRAVIEWSLT